MLEQAPKCYRCPDHEVFLVGAPTRFGTRHSCPFPECTVVCWSGGTSTPADGETRQLRRQCHQLFDQLWKTGVKFRNRNKAYRWLQRAMNLSKEKAHIGMFDKEQCEKLLEIIREGVF